MTQEEVNAYLKGKGKGNRANTSGKGFGRKGNPTGRDGQKLKCHKCGSEDHLIKNCPQGGGGGGKGKGGGSTGMPFAAPTNYGNPWGLPQNSGYAEGSPAYPAINMDDPDVVELWTPGTNQAYAATLQVQQVRTTQIEGPLGELLAEEIEIHQTSTSTLMVDEVGNVRPDPWRPPVQGSSPGRSRAGSQSRHQQHRRRSRSPSTDHESGPSWTNVSDPWSNFQGTQSSGQSASPPFAEIPRFPSPPGPLGFEQALLGSNTNPQPPAP